MKTLGPSRIDLTNSPFGQSEMAGRIREFDWSKTSLGSSENWPQHLRDAVETVVSCGFSATLQWGREATLFYNDAYIPLIGSKHPNALGRSIFETFPEIRQPYGPIFQRVWNGETVVCEDQPYRYIRDIAPINTWFTMSYSPIRDRDGSVAGVLAIGFEITPRVELRASEERFRLFVDNVREYAFVQTGLDYTITGWNPGAERVFGYKSGEILGRNFSLLLTPEDHGRDRLSAEMEVISQGGRFEDTGSFLRKNGTPLWVHWVTEPIRDAQGRVIGLAKVLRDETNRLRTETSMRQSEKLAVVGRLASSIAHEINNPLEAVTNLIYLARFDAESARTIDLLDQAERELRRISLITTETLRFHRQNTQPSLSDVAELLESVLLLHEGRIRQENITINRRYRAHPKIVCLPSEIRQVLANLVGNAIEAMQGNTDLRLLSLRIQVATDIKTGRRGLRLVVADTGSGMSAAAAARVFEAFFTTKETTGTGLGLWVSAEIVKKHRGTLSFRSRQSQPHRGTLFSLFLAETV